MGIRAELHADDATISKKIRELSQRKVPLIAIVGEREAANGTVNLRRFGVSGQEEIAFAQLEEELSRHQNHLAVAR
jgi:threonyl-tRNA synthetase